MKSQWKGSGFVYLRHDLPFSLTFHCFQSPPSMPNSTSCVLCGATAGLAEVLVCHPLDTIKTRMQVNAAVPWHAWRTLYRGIGPACLSIMPKYAVRFAAYDLAMRHVCEKNSFWSGLFAGVAEAVLVVNSVDVLKIRLQTAASIRDPVQRPTLLQMALSEGRHLFTRGLPMTVVRQASNQATNFYVHDRLTTFGLPSAAAGFLSGAVGPLLNHPLDVIKTVVQSAPPGRAMRFWDSVHFVLAERGWLGLYRGLMPRLARIMPGQAITFGVYDACQKAFFSKGNQ
jgi:solute carrier family 25 (mitochondrial citrate transporter), member 1